MYDIVQLHAHKSVWECNAIYVCAALKYHPTQ